MVIKLEEAYPLLRCPGTGATLRRVGDKEIEADGHSGRRYAIKEGVPILVDFKESILDETAIRKSLDSTLPRRDNGKMVRAIKALLFSSNRVAKRNVQEQTRLLKEKSCKPALLVVGGGMVGAGLEELYQDQDVRIIAFDIYASCYVQFVADAHAIPLADASVDGVIVQAVLEHVLEPWIVVKEIWRVLKDGGLVYAETPFMQQVHEGPYDFTRFTESGHRYLFRRFSCIRSGCVAGAGTQLIWALSYFFRGLFRSRLAARVTRAAFCWLRAFDYVILEPYSVDAASGVFFLGKKRADVMRPNEIVAYYQGAS